MRWYSTVLSRCFCLAVLLCTGVLCKLTEEQKKALCKDKGAGELFRISADDCRNVITCTVSGLEAIRCPPGLAFDLEKQTCDWKQSVTNCDQLTKRKKVRPLLSTDQPLCSNPDVEELACGDGVCIPREAFCDGTEDCADGSDESYCAGDDDPNRAPACNKEVCRLPDCFCSEDGTEVPGDLCPSNTNCSRVPQMVTITFDGAINNNNIDIYEELFKERYNPNGCTIKGSFFVSHKYTNYSAVENMHRLGHEIAAHSITNYENETYWSLGSKDEWAKEMAGSRYIIEKFSQITDNSVVGLRAPYLRVGGNNQFKMMEEQQFLYDSSITAPLQNPPLWPYTLYFKMPHKCHGNLQNCPTRPLAVWEVVLNELDRREDPSVEEHLPGCAMIDSCSSIRGEEQFYNFLNYNFYRHYEQNRAPLGLGFHAAWLKNNPRFFDTFLYWLDEIREIHTDVYFITMTQVIQWMQNPVDASGARTYLDWQDRCNPGPRTECLVPNRCKLSTSDLDEVFQMYTCVRCPNRYPWLNDPEGLGLDL